MVALKKINCLLLPMAVVLLFIFFFYKNVPKYDLLITITDEWGEPISLDKYSKDRILRVKAGPFPVRKLNRAKYIVYGIPKGTKIDVLVEAEPYHRIEYGFVGWQIPKAEKSLVMVNDSQINLSLTKFIPHVQVKESKHWKLINNLKERWIKARFENYALEVLVDWDDALDDGHSVDIIVKIDDKSYDNLSFRDRSALIHANRGWATQERVEVKGVGKTLKIAMEEGSVCYFLEKIRECPPNLSNESISLKANLTVVDRSLVVELKGFYYILLSKTNTTLELFDQENQLSAQYLITEETPVFVDYYENVSKIVVNDGVFGELDIQTNVRLLQIDTSNTVRIPENKNLPLAFELDFDHSFKEYGQKDMKVRFVLPL